MSPYELIPPDGPVGGEAAELLDESVHRHHDSEDTTDDDSDTVTCGPLPWWKRPSPWWYVSMPT
jgi:hypothetical protein